MGVKKKLIPVLGALLRGERPGGDCDLLALLRAARWQGVFPLAYHRLREDGRELPDEAVACYRQQQALCLRRAEVLRGLLAAFREEGVRAFPWKGPSLAARVYPFPFLRQASVDLDLLVRPEDRAPLVALLGRRGFQRHPGRSAGEPGAEVYLSPGRDCAVDLHASLLPRGDDRSLAWLMDTPVPMEFEGCPYQDLPLPDLLLVLDLNLLGANGHIHWKYYLDMARILAHFRAEDWSGLIMRLSRYEYRTSLYFSLKNAAALFRAEVPPAAWEQLETPFRRRLYALFAWHFPSQYEHLSEHRQPQTWIWKVFLDNLYQDDWVRWSGGMVKTGAGLLIARGMTGS